MLPEDLTEKLSSMDLANEGLTIPPSPLPNPSLQILMTLQENSKFHKFQELPTELRLDIWKIACYLECRVHRVWFIYPIHRTPPVLHACLESREVALKHFVLTAGHIPSHKYVNPKTDALLLDFLECTQREPPRTWERTDRIQEDIYRLPGEPTIINATEQAIVILEQLVLAHGWPELHYVLPEFWEGLRARCPGIRKLFVLAAPYLEDEEISSLAGFEENNEDSFQPFDNEKWKVEQLVAAYTEYMSDHADEHLELVFVRHPNTPRREDFTNIVFNNSIEFKGDRWCAGWDICPV